MTVTDGIAALTARLAGEFSAYDARLAAVEGQAGDGTGEEGYGGGFVVVPNPDAPMEVVIRSHFGQRPDGQVYFDPDNEVPQDEAVLLLADPPSGHLITWRPGMDPLVPPSSGPEEPAEPSIPLSQKGAAGGVATLGADQKVPAEQLPPVTPAVPVTTWRAAKATNSTNSTTTAINDPELSIAVAAGLYRLQAFFQGYNPNGAALNMSFVASTGTPTLIAALRTTWPSSATTAPSYFRFSSGSYTFAQLTSQINNTSATDLPPVQLDGVIRLAVDATVTVRIASGSATPATLVAGSWMQLDRMGN